MPHTDTRSRDRTYSVAVALLAVAGVTLLWASGRLWVSAVVSPAGLPRVDVDVTGTQIAGANSAAALLMIAGIGGIWASRGWWRVGIGALLAAASGWVVASSIGFGLNLPGAAEQAAARVAGVPVSDLTSVAVGLWWWVCLLAGVAGLVGSVLVMGRGRRWSGPARRYERTAAAPGATMSAAQVWDALDRGEDPTIGPEMTQ